MATRYDAVVIGSGPNGFSAAITLARAGRSVLVMEAKSVIGGGARSEELTLPGFTHDTFSAVHPMALESEFFASLPLNKYGLEWIHSPNILAHPTDHGESLIVNRSVHKTADGLGIDGRRYLSIMGGLLKSWEAIKSEILRPFRFPRSPFSLAKFGLLAGLPVAALVKLLFSNDSTRTLLAGVAAHSCLPLDSLGTASFGLVLTLAGHNVGWPIPKGGAGSISRALAGYLKSLGGEIMTDCPVRSLTEIPRCASVFFDLTPRQIVSIAGDALSKSYLAKLRKYQYGPGVFKMDWALSAPIPWKESRLASAATVHLAGSWDELRRSERGVWRGGVTDRPFVLLSQPSLFDRTRAPVGKETAWAYCHVPNGSLMDMSARIESQIERFAPGFRDVILAKSALGPSELEKRNPNLVGGDLNGGAVSMNQLLFRPTSRLYSTSAQHLFICSSSTPPGGGVHGLCGYYAAQEALKGILK